MRYYLGLSIYYVLIVLHTAIFCVSLFGCSSIDRLDMISQCQYVETEYVGGVLPSITEDAKQQGSARLGCVKHYGEGACLTRFTKTGDLQYQAICRRKSE